VLEATRHAKVPARLLGRPFGRVALQLVRHQIERAKGCNRSQIAHRVCQQLGWTTRGGRLALMSARVALLRLHAAGWIHLPAPRHGNRNRRRYQTCLPVPPPSEPIHCGLEDLQPLDCQLVCGQGPSRLWNSLIERYHYLGHQNLPGAQLRYLLYARGGRLLGAIGFGAAAWKVAPRDQWIGWNSEQRCRALGLVLNNARFLIVPWAAVPNLAGHCLRHCLRRLPEDFQQRYGWRPVLVETFVDTRYGGASYRAAHWIYLGLTQGRGKKGAHKVGAQTPLPVKQVWVKPLSSDFRRRLCGQEEPAHG
jgi:hypothetical protein